MNPDDRLDDGELVQRFRAGDEEAFRILLQRHRAELTARIRHCLPRRLDRKVAVSDVFQESLIVAYKRRGDLEDRGKNALRNWLLGIVENKAREAVRRHEQADMRSVRREVTRAERGATMGFAGSGPSPSQVAMGEELRGLVVRAMGRLPDHYREVLRLTREHMLDLKATAERMGRSHDSVKKLYGRAICRFREELDRLRSGG